MKLLKIETIQKMITPLIETILLLFIAMFQWTNSILIAIYVSQQISPIGSHKDFAPDSGKSVMI